jgi:hypothetical protein
MNPKAHIGLIQLETQLIRARLQLKAAIALEAYDPVLIWACQESVRSAKDAIAMHNWEASHAD